MPITSCCLQSLLQASNISDALFRPHAAEAALCSNAEGAEACYDEDGNPEPVQHRVPALPGPHVHPLQVRRGDSGLGIHVLVLQGHKKLFCCMCASPANKNACVQHSQQRPWLTIPNITE